MEAKNRPEIIRYYRECYQADNRELLIRDVLTNNKEPRYLFNQEEIRRAYQPDGVYLYSAKSETIKIRLDAYKREKKLLLGVGMMIFKSDNASFGVKKHTTFCTPLLYHEADLIAQDDTYVLRFNPEDVTWNAPVLRTMLETPEMVLEMDGLLRQFSSLRLDLDQVGEWLDERFPNNTVRVAEGLPNLEGLNSLKRKATKEVIELVPGMIAFVTDRSAASRGLIHELEMMEDLEELSRPLQQLLHLDNFSPSRPVKGLEKRVPGILSPAQKQILENASSQVVSQVIGPPGTGKSYTIGSIALEQFLRDRSILIVAQTESAMDVIQHKLVQDLGLSTESVVRCGKHYRFNELKKYIDRLTGWQLPAWNQKDVSGELKRVNQQIANYTREFTRETNSEVADGIRLARIHQSGRVGFFDKLWLWFKHHFRSGNRLYFEQSGRIDSLQKEREELILQQIDHSYYQSLVKTLKNKRLELIAFRESLAARTSTVQEERLKGTDFKVILDTLPIWLCTLDALHKALPMEKELFDVVIFDEATQCNIASCLPALQRARSAVVVGDPKQLRHVSFLSGAEQQRLMEKMGINEGSVPFTLDYRNKSIIDLANQGIQDHQAVVMLDEHYRSLPEIIAFSNQKFYEGKLRIMTEKPVPHSHYPIKEIRCKGERKRNINEVEAHEIIVKLKSILRSQEDVPKAAKLSIGLLSFFREQADYLQGFLFREFEYEQLEQHQLRAGTPYSFQGEERDIMLLSFCVDDASVKTVSGYLNRDDVFNVGITRAKSLQLIYTSFDRNQVPKTHQVYQYLKSINETSLQSVNQELELRGHFLKELVGALQKNKIQVLENYTVAGMPLDLVAIHRTQLIAIDLIGFPGEYENPFTLDRIHILSRVSLPVFPVSLYEWIQHREVVLNALCEKLGVGQSDSDEEDLKVIQTGHWHRLIPIDHNLATQLRTIELDFSARDDERGLMQIESILTAYEQFYETLDTKLNPGELTYKRYKSAVDQLLLSTLNNFSQINILQHSLPAVTGGAGMSPEIKALFQQQIDLIQGLYTNNDQAVEQFQKLALLWSSVDLNKQNSDQDNALKEIEILAKQVKKYGL